MAVQLAEPSYLSGADLDKQLAAQIEGLREVLR